MGQVYLTSASSFSTLWLKSRQRAEKGLVPGNKDDVTEEVENMDEETSAKRDSFGPSLRGWLTKWMAALLSNLFALSLLLSTMFSMSSSLSVNLSLLFSKVSPSSAFSSSGSGEWVKTRTWLLASG